MRLAISPEHRDFFTKNQFIAFEELLPLDQIAALSKQADEVIAHRLHTSPSKLAHRTSLEIFQMGYDLWRDSDTIKKTTHKNVFASIASDLFQTLPLRYGFDQYIVTGQSLLQPCTLQEISALNPLAGALMLPLKDLSSPLSFFPLPEKAGSGLFLSASLTIPWPQLFATPDLHVLMIAYAQDKTSFRPDIPDMHATQLKKLGYAFNDQLNDSLHPVLIRKN
jgi:hypothetical protein